MSFISDIGAIDTMIGFPHGDMKSTYKFITDQVVATCRFTGQQPHFEPRFIDYAIDNLRVRQKSEAKVPVLVEAR